MVPPMIFLELLKYWKKYMVPTPYDFLRIIKILKNHMIPPMIFDKTIQKYNIFAWYSLKNIHINFSKCLYIPPSWKFQKSDLGGGGGVYRGKRADNFHFQDKWREKIGLCFAPNMNGKFVKESTS